MIGPSLAVGFLAIASVANLAAQTPDPNRWDVTEAHGRTRVVSFTTTEGTDMSVDISPDGRWILFDLLGHVYRVPATGGEAENLTRSSGVALNFHPRYSPDGNNIAFVSDRGGQDNLWVMNADGTAPHPVFLDPVTRITEPSWTADGSAIIAVRNFPTYSMHRRSARIWRFDLGGRAEELVGAPSGTQAYWPAASPDGRYLYYMFSTFAEPLHGRQRSQHIRRYEFTTRAIGAVTTPESDRWYWSDGAIEMAPEPSPDGRWLAFARRIPGASMSYRGHTLKRRTALWLRDLENGRERILMDPITFDMAEAHGMKNLRILPGYGWAQDSKSVVVSQGGKIRRVWLEDGRVETIPFSAKVERTVSETARSTTNITDGPFPVRMIQWPSSTADGRTLVFGAAGRVWAQELPNGTPRRISSDTTGATELMPEVSPDGQWVAYVTWDDGVGGHLWKAPLGGGKPERLTTEPREYLSPVWMGDGGSLLSWPVGARAIAGLGWRGISSIGWYGSARQAARPS
jgi:Tol biopolymer transport system component